MKTTAPASTKLPPRLPSAPDPTIPLIAYPLPRSLGDGHDARSDTTATDTTATMLKLVLVGDANVGKTSLYDRFMDGSPPNHANEATIGVSFSKVFVGCSAIRGARPC